jgi:hypothetical protein
MVFMLKLERKFSKKRRNNKYKTLTWERLNEVLYIDPETGECYWKVSNNNRIVIGDRAGCIRKDPRSNLYYRTIQIDGKKYSEHILIWFFVKRKWPSRGIDHKNLDGLDNKIKNLRLCTGTQNKGNSKKRKDNTSGYKGICWNKKRKKWEVQIQYKRKHISLGFFDDPYKGHLKYCKEHKKLFGEFSRTN